MPKTIDITPSTEMLMATRRTGYDTYEAMFELVDNAVDALRQKLKNTTNFKYKDPYVHVNIMGTSAKKTTKIIISDNGTGIDYDFLTSGSVFSMGRSATRQLSSESTGVFGMGMKSAAQTLGKKLKILTTTTDITNLVGAYVDFDKVLQGGKWRGSFLETNEISDQDRNLFKKYVGRMSGTVVIIEDILDGVPTKQAMITTLRRKLTHHYRHILNPSSKLGYYLPIDIFVSAVRKNPIESGYDPLCVEHERTKVLIGTKDGDFDECFFKGHTFKIRLTHTKLRAGEKKTAIDGLSDLGYGHGGIIRQGAYFIRHGRELVSMPFWKHASHAGNLFAEISFVDDGIGQPPIRTDYGKKGIVIEDSFKSYILRHHIEPFIKKLGKEAREAAKELTKGTRDDITRSIEKTVLPSEHFGRAQRTQKDKTENKIKSVFSKSKSNNSTRKNSKYRGTSIATGNNDIEIKFEEESWPGSPYPYNVEYNAGDPIVKVLINIEHTWIKKAIFGNTNAKEIARNMQLIATNCISLMYQEDEIRNEIITNQGVLLQTFDNDFGQRVEAEVENVELDAVIIPDTNIDYGEELMNK